MAEEKLVGLCRHGDKSKEPGGRKAILTTEGVGQVEKSGEALRKFLETTGVTIAAAEASPLIRAQQTAAHLLGSSLFKEYPKVNDTLGCLMDEWEDLMRRVKDAKEGSPVYLDFHAADPDFIERVGQTLWAELENKLDDLEIGQMLVWAGHSGWFEQVLAIAKGTQNDATFAENYTATPQMKPGEMIILRFSKDNEFLGFIHLGEAA